MVNETRDFGAAMVLTIVGLAVMLYGVYLDTGLAFNEFMAAGGALVAVGIGIIVVAVSRLEGGHGTE
jgi:positive regulator of sigma E activity